MVRIVGARPIVVRRGSPRPFDDLPDDQKAVVLKPPPRFPRKLPLPDPVRVPLRQVLGIESRQHQVGGTVLLGLILAVPTFYFITLGWPG
jgi:hypothetical protein